MTELMLNVPVNNLSAKLGYFLEADYKMSCSRAQHSASDIPNNLKLHTTTELLIKYCKFNFARILICDIKNSRLMHDLSTSVKDRVILTFCVKGFYFPHENI